VIFLLHRVARHCVTKLEPILSVCRAALCGIARHSTTLRPDFRRSCRTSLWSASSFVYLNVNLWYGISTYWLFKGNGAIKCNKIIEMGLLLRMHRLPEAHVTPNSETSWFGQWSRRHHMSDFRQCDRNQKCVAFSWSDASRLILTAICWQQKHCKFKQIDRTVFL
jgi:hypothetical protein